MLGGPGCLYIVARGGNIKAESVSLLWGSPGVEPTDLRSPGRIAETSA